MIRRRLGQSDLWISPIGLGTWAMSGTGWNQGWGPQDDTVSIATIHRAVERGINWVDTAATYGIGHAEEVVGAAVRSLPAADRPFVFSKCGVIRDASDPHAPAIRTLAPASIRAEVEGSLRRLGVDRIDMLQFHWPDETGTPIEESWRTMADLIEEGKVGAAGLSNFSVDLMERCHRIRLVDGIQPGLSLIHRAALADVIPWANQNGVSAIVFSPLRSGLLTDAITLSDIEAFDSSDWRRTHPDFQSPAVDRNLTLRDLLRPIARRHETSVSSIAIAWALSMQGVTATIAGAREPREIDAWSDAGSLALSEADRKEIASALLVSGAGEGPVS
jgi:aryl-alcohol dehydrogenase-like predicted oxidoreductase